MAACLGYTWQRDLDDAASVLPPLFGGRGLQAGTNVSRLSDSSLQRLLDQAGLICENFTVQICRAADDEAVGQYVSVLQELGLG